MEHADIANKHKDVKKKSYWDNLVECGTATYKEQKIIELLDQYGPEQVQDMVDIGVGTCDFMFRLQRKLSADSLTCMDYDAKVIEQLKKKYSNENVKWLVSDVFEMDQLKKKYDLVFLLDVVHEVYSFYGRPNRDINQPVDHNLGIKYVLEMLKNVIGVTTDKGAVIISDNVLTDEDREITVKLRTKKIIETVKYFIQNYPTKQMVLEWASEDEIKINSRDFCILLTQYNKIKNKNFDRWNVERMEIHQYFSLIEFKEAFGKFGFTVEAIVETPTDAKEEWESDFEVIGGLSGIPSKRITLLAHR